MSLFLALRTTITFTGSSGWFISTSTSNLKWSRLQQPFLSSFVGWLVPTLVPTPGLIKDQLSSALSPCLRLKPRKIFTSFSQYTDHVGCIAWRLGAFRTREDRCVVHLRGSSRMEGCACYSTIPGHVPRCAKETSLLLEWHQRCLALPHHSQYRADVFRQVRLSAQCAILISIWIRSLLQKAK